MEDMQSIENEVVSAVIVEEIPSTRSSDVQTNLYRIKYKDINLENVKLSISEVKALKAARGIELDTVSVNLYGYLGWIRWESGRPEEYTRAFSPNDTIAQNCGIPGGYYTVKDVYLEQSYTLPNNNVIVIDESDYLNGSTNIGWNPDNLYTTGYRVSKTGTSLTLQTAVFLIDTTIAGQQFLRTYPANISNIVWKLKYVQIIIN